MSLPDHQNQFVLDALAASGTPWAWLCFLGRAPWWTSLFLSAQRQKYVPSLSRNASQKQQILGCVFVCCLVKQFTRCSRDPPAVLPFLRPSNPEATHNKRTCL